MDERRIARAQARIARRMESLEKTFGKSLASALMNQDGKAFLQSLDWRNANEEMISELQKLHGLFDEGFFQKAINSEDRRKALFVLLVFKRREAVRYAKQMKKSEVDEVVVRLQKPLVLDDHVSSLPQSEIPEALSVFPTASPILPDSYFSGLGFSELDMLAGKYASQVSAEAIRRGNGENVPEGQTPRDYWPLIGEHAKPADAEIFFSKRMEELGEGSPFGAELRAAVVHLAVRSAIARSWLESFGLKVIEESPDFLVDVMMHETGRAKFEAAKLVRDKKCGITKEQARSIVDNLDFEDQYSYASFLCVLDMPVFSKRILARVAQSGGVNQERRTGDRRTLISAIGENFVATHSFSDVYPEVANLPHLRSVHDEFASAPISGNLNANEKRSLYNALFHAGGKYRIYSSAWSSFWYEQNGGDYGAVREEYWNLSREDRSWVDGNIDRVLLAKANTRFQAMGFMIHTRSINSHFRKLDKMARSPTPNSETAPFEKWTSHFSRDTFYIGKGSASFQFYNSYRQLLQCEPTSLPVRNTFLWMKSLIDDKHRALSLALGGKEVGKGNAAEVFKRLSEDDKLWVQAIIAVHVVFDPKNDNMMRFIIEAGLAGCFFESIRSISAEMKQGTPHSVKVACQCGALANADYGRWHEMYYSESAGVDALWNSGERGRVLLWALSRDNYLKCGGRIRGAVAMEGLTPEERETLKTSLKSLLAQPSRLLMKKSVVMFISEMGWTGEFQSELEHLIMDAPPAAQNDGGDGRESKIEKSRRELASLAKAALGMLSDEEVQEILYRDLETTHLLESGGQPLACSGGKHRILAAALYMQGFKANGGDYAMALADYHLLPEEEREWVDGWISEYGLRHANFAESSILFIENAEIVDKFKGRLAELAGGDHGEASLLAEGALCALGMKRTFIAGVVKRFAHGTVNVRDAMALYSSPSARNVLAVFAPHKIEDFHWNVRSTLAYSGAPPALQTVICTSIVSFLVEYSLRMKNESERLITATFEGESHPEITEGDDEADGQNEKMLSALEAINDPSINKGEEATDEESPFQKSTLPSEQAQAREDAKSYLANVSRYIDENNLMRDPVIRETVLKVASETKSPELIRIQTRYHLPEWSGIE